MGVLLRADGLNPRVSVEISRCWRAMPPNPFWLDWVSGARTALADSALPLDHKTLNHKTKVHSISSPNPHKCTSVSLSLFSSFQSSLPLSSHLWVLKLPFCKEKNSISSSKCSIKPPPSCKKRAWNTIMQCAANELWPRRQKTANSSFQSLSACERVKLFAPLPPKQYVNLLFWRQNI